MAFANTPSAIMSVPTVLPEKRKSTSSSAGSAPSTARRARAGVTPGPASARPITNATSASTTRPAKRAAGISAPLLKTPLARRKPHTGSSTSNCACPFADHLEPPVEVARELGIAVVAIGLERAHGGRILPRLQDEGAVGIARIEGRVGGQRHHDIPPRQFSHEVSPRRWPSGLGQDG